MTVLHRTHLTTSQKIQCAAAALARQHEHGSKTALSEGLCDLSPHGLCGGDDGRGGASEALLRRGCSRVRR